MNKAPPPVYVVDDDHSLLNALTRLLKSAGYQVLPFSCPSDFMKKADPAAPGCVILDMLMPGYDGLDVQEWLLAQQSPLSVLFLTGHGQIKQCVGALKSGAVDFLTKPVHEKILLKAVTHALETSEQRHLEQNELTILRRREASLSPREHEVFQLIITGLLNKQTAAILGTSEKTIKVHRARVLDKMQASSLAELVNQAGRLGVPQKR